MMPFGETITVLRRPARDKFGDQSYDAHHTVSGVGIDWRATDTDNSSGELDFRSSVSSEVTLYCPRGTDILASDQIELPDGQVYAVVGKPAPWRSPMTGWAPGVEVRAKRVSG
ncbi:hypothetical protein [Nocardia brasiliensis]|uniref:hypothetical protein n=1 Tax=Nocardia brasiliensis TaxID=37326 RepID=UPI002457DDF4|nr:hypothetical protein [Nocardia brasiliensis]